MRHDATLFREEVGLSRSKQMMSSLGPTPVPVEAPDEPGLLARAQAGEAEAFGELCRIYEPRLLRQSVSWCGNMAMAEDLTEDTLVEAWRCLRRYHGRCQFFTWLCAILLNRHRNLLRRHRLAVFSSFFSRDDGLLQDQMNNVTARESPPDEAAAARDEARLVQECIAALPRKQRQVVFLRFYAHDSLEGIAAALGCSVGTVKSRLFHALDKLRGMKALNRQFEKLNRRADDTKAKGGDAVGALPSLCFFWLLAVCAFTAALGEVLVR